MIDRSRGPSLNVTTRVGQKELGPGTLVMDDDVLTVMRANESERPVRVRFTAIDGLGLNGASVTLVLRDGRSMSLACDDVVALHADLLARCRTLPELTRTLRAFGSRRGLASGHADAGEQQRFFAPLLVARRQAVVAETPVDAIAAFDCLTLTRAFDATLRRFINERHAENGAERRAFEAALVDACEPLRDAIDQLRRRADEARAAVDDLRRWRAWASQLRDTFEVADRVWLSVDAALGGSPWSL
jgi:hypothetical protein